MVSYVSLVHIMLAYLKLIHIRSGFCHIWWC